VKGFMIKRITSILLLLIVVMNSAIAFADAVDGDVIISLGDNLTQAEREAILKEFGEPKNAQIIVTTNAEEHEYLGGIIPAKQIGSIAISSVMITFTEKGSGLNVEASDRITYITEQNYTNALITAGIEDADIKITSPRNASGTAALTGIMKAYEISTGKAISEEVKKVANEEMIRSAELGEEIGEEKAAEIMSKIKLEVANRKPETTEEVREIVIGIVKNLDVSLSDEQTEKLVELYDKMKSLDIDWNKVANRIEDFASKASDYLASEEGQNFLQKLKEVIIVIIDWFASLFR
jgi:uncharacterized protein YpuA (DUF1002 family)